MKRFGRYICDKCHVELDPRATYAVCIGKITLSVEMF